MAKKRTTKKKPNFLLWVNKYPQVKSAKKRIAALEKRLKAERKKAAAARKKAGAAYKRKYK